MFDFKNATAHSSLPALLTVSGLAATFSATGQGFSLQPVNTMGFTPAGFSGNSIDPSSVYAADLQIRFSVALACFSILCAPQKLACDSSVRRRVTTYLNSDLGGAATPNGHP